MPTTPDELRAYLDNHGIAVSVMEHPPLFTVEQSQKLRGEIPGAHTKNLFLKDKKDRLYLIVAEEDATIDLKHLHGRIGASGRLSFGSANLLMETLGVTPGAVTPFGLINDVDARVAVVLDAALMENDIVNCHPLVNTATASISANGLLAFIRATGHEPRVVPLDSDAPAPEL